MPEIYTFTKEILKKYIDAIIRDTSDFEYNNWKEENFLLDLPDKWEFSIALFDGSSITGFSINSRKSDVFYMHFFYILKKYRKSKAGEGLLNACENKAAENKLQIVRLKCNKNNFAALNFYLKNGYAINKTDLHDSNLYLLEKKLNQ